MRRSSTLSLPSDSLPSKAFSRGAILLPVALLCACVTRGTYDEAVTERDRLSERVRLLEASNESLDAERVKVIDEMEDLRLAREKLDRDVTRLRRIEKQLSTDLADREHRLASRERELDKLRGTYEGLVEDLEAEVAAGQIQIEQLKEGLRLNLTQDILFASGSSKLNMAGESVIWKVAARLVDLPHGVEVQGHTDDVPVRPGARYPSNWELAAARASEVVRLLAKRGVDATRLTAVSFGEFHPVASNDTPEGRAKNRRIEIRLEPKKPSEEVAGGEPSEDQVAGSPAP